MNEMVGSIASILEQNFWDEGDWAGTDAGQRKKFKEVARDILDAIRVPPEQMIRDCYVNTSHSYGGDENSFDYVSDQNKLDFWTDMIDLALAELTEDR